MIATASNDKRLTGEIKAEIPRIARPSAGSSAERKNPLASRLEVNVKPEKTTKYTA
jgi:hypothetical protein